MVQIGMKIEIKLVYKIILMMDGRCVWYGSCNYDRFSIVFCPPQSHIFVKELEEF